MIEKPFIPGWNVADVGLRPFSAELWLIVTIIAVLMTPFFTRRSNLACAVVSLAGLMCAFVSTLIVGVKSHVIGLHFRGLLVTDHFSVMWKAMLLLFVMGIILMWFSVVAWRMHEGDGPEFFTLLLGATLGMCLMSETSNLLMLFMAVEMASLPSYVLAGFRKTHRIGAEASLKYVLFGAATSAVMVYGLSMLYGLYGTLQIEDLAVAMMRGSGSGALLAVAVFGVIVGVGFKISAVPFHFWCPDVFEGASVDVSAFLSVASKGAALALLLRVLMLIGDAVGYHDVPGVSLTTIAIVIGVIGSVTATVGNTAAFVQNNLKRLLAYSSIAHAGYMLCALSLIVKGNVAPAGDWSPAGDTAVTASGAILLYLAVYLFMNLGAFTVAGLIWRETGSENLADYAGLGRRAPVLAACMTAFLFSLVGLPPFAGFVAKLNIMYVLGANGGWWWVLVAVIGVNTILSLYYYMRIARLMYLQSSDAPALSVNPLGSMISIVCAVMLLVMLVAFGPLNRLTSAFGQVYLGGSVPGAAQTAAAR
jgi:NADH-quinone oxidoreductase subunit N